MGEIERLQENIKAFREILGEPTKEELWESHIRSVYANMAIDCPGITLEEVREVLSGIKEVRSHRGEG